MDVSSFDTTPWAIATVYGAVIASAFCVLFHRLMYRRGYKDGYAHGAFDERNKPGRENLDATQI